MLGWREAGRACLPPPPITLLGDTAGDDIPTDANPSGDTSIRAIRFNRIDVTFGPGLACG